MKTAVLLPGKDKRVYSGHPWIFKSDISYVDSDCRPGDVLTVRAGNGRFLARAVYNPRSQIALRILTWKDEPINADWIREKVRCALDYRRSFADLHSCRLIFAESDGLPAVICDSFGEIVVMQCLSLGMEQFKETICDALEEELHPRGIYERADVPVRTLEGLDLESRILRGTVPDEKTEILENGIRFLVDVKNGQKTGYFLDQKENRAAIAPFVKGKTVLDCFTHIGSFALHAAHYQAQDVIGVDISEYACQCAAENAALNGLDRVRFICANAFDYLRQEADEGKQYDVVILDPPAFTKTRAQIASAERGYKEINLRGIKLTRPGGILVTCSCSQHMLPDAFRAVVHSAAVDAHARLMQIEWRTQGRDHPILAASAETQYLKCGIYRVDK